MFVPEERIMGGAECRIELEEQKEEQFTFAVRVGKKG
jgi:hypothetical protein